MKITSKRIHSWVYLYNRLGQTADRCLDSQNLPRTAIFLLMSSIVLIYSIYDYSRSPFSFKLVKWDRRPIPMLVPYSFESFVEFVIYFCFQCNITFPIWDPHDLLWVAFRLISQLNDFVSKLAGGLFSKVACFLDHIQGASRRSNCAALEYFVIWVVENPDWE